MSCEVSRSEFINCNECHPICCIRNIENMDHIKNLKLENPSQRRIVGRQIDRQREIKRDILREIKFPKFENYEYVLDYIESIEEDISNRWSRYEYDSFEIWENVERYSEYKLYIELIDRRSAFRQILSESISEINPRRKNLLLQDYTSKDMIALINEFIEGENNVDCEECVDYDGCNLFLDDENDLFLDDDRDFFL